MSGTTRALVYHVGELDGDREPPVFSYEGAGLSVSEHPDAWKTIAQDVRGTTYTLHNPDGEFYAAEPSGACEDVQNWAVDNGYANWTTAYKGVWPDIEEDTQRYVLSTSRQTARKEAQIEACGESDERYVEQVEALELAENGVSYWEDAFISDHEIAEPLMVQSLTAVWYARENEYSGVWWDEEYAPFKGSAPRGVIFQSALENWQIYDGEYPKSELRVT